jgi:hypothetical protein
MGFNKTMFPNTSPTQQLSKAERKLCKFYKGLRKGERETLLSFAEFLNTKQTASNKAKKTEAVLQHPILSIAEENESVVKGIKRLKSSYFMIDDEDLLQQVSSLMSEHIMKGVSAQDVILKIEAVFEQFYQDYKNNFTKNND